LIGGFGPLSHFGGKQMPRAYLKKKGLVKKKKAKKTKAKRK